MSAADYYGASSGGRNDGRNDGPVYSESGQQRPYPASRYSTQGALPYPSSSNDIDTSYEPHSPSPASQNNAHPDPFADNIPLHETGKSKHKHKKTGSNHNQYAYGEEEQHENKHNSHYDDRPKRKKKWPIVCWILATIQIGVFVGELIKNSQLTGSPISTKPVFNPMIGPSSPVLINMGARYIPCMTTVTGTIVEVKSPPAENVVRPNQEITNNPQFSNMWFCPNSTTADTYKCTLAELCGMGGIPRDSKGLLAPNQWYRLIVPIFLHAGVIHIAFNMLIQLRLGVDMEREIGPIRFAIVYFAAGIFGNILGANYGPSGAPSVGASGSLFGIIALVLLDILYSWRELLSPMKDLFWVVIQIVISFVLGLLPGLDNFAHIGGFLMGLLLGLTVMRSPSIIASRLGIRNPPYEPVTPYSRNSELNNGIRSFIESPKGFFSGRKPAWWAWWVVRAAMLVTAIVVFIVLLNNFYVYRRECSWCKYLSCIPVSNWCNLADLTFTLTDVPLQSTPRDGETFRRAVALTHEYLDRIF